MKSTSPGTAPSPSRMRDKSTATSCRRGTLSSRRMGSSSVMRRECGDSSSRPPTDERHTELHWRTTSTRAELAASAHSTSDFPRRPVSTPRSCSNHSHSTSRIASSSSPTKSSVSDVSPLSLVSTIDTDESCRHAPMARPSARDAVSLRCSGRQVVPPVDAHHPLPDHGPIDTSDARGIRTGGDGSSTESGWREFLERDARRKEVSHMKLVPSHAD
jgi:hypothetical protein